MTAPSLKAYAQGQSEVSADNLNSFQQTCNTFTQLRDFVGLPGIQVWSRGGATVNDDLGGVFYWSATATAADDNQDVIKPTGAGATGRWLRLFSSGALGYTYPASGAVERTISSRLSDIVSLKDFGAVGDGSTNDTTAITNAAALGIPVYVPPGDYASTAPIFTLTGFPKIAWGSGQLEDADGNKRGKFFSIINAAPSSLGDEDSVTTAFNGDLSCCAFPIEHRIRGSATLGQPTSGYLYTPEAYAIFGFVFNESGYNNSTTTSDGRTAAVFQRVRAYQHGQGDCVAYNASGFVDSTKTGSTVFLANPAVVLFNGDCSAGIDGAYLNPFELYLDDQGNDVAGIGMVVNLDRNDDTGAKYAWWAGLRLQTKGTQPIDVGVSLQGDYNFGIDLTYGLFTSNAAITMKSGHLIYFNADNSDPSGLARFPNALGSVTLGYNGTTLEIAGGLEINGNLGFYGTAPIAKPTVTGSKAANAALTSLMTALAGLGLVTDSTS